MENEDYASIPTKCFGCGKDQFKLTRMEGSEVLAECINCGHSHMLDSVLEEKTKIPVVIWFSAPKNLERCDFCRSTLKIWDISYDGNTARSQCSKCGMIHTFKKTRLSGWKLLRVTRRVDTNYTTSNSDLDLTEIDGIGSKRTELLALAGIKTISDLANASISILSSKTGISQKLLTKWIAQSKRLVA
ncbi:MAG: helix-hairpin-helix domain-containing protein [Candidatus Bathyarchaeota archaeon]